MFKENLSTDSFCFPFLQYGNVLKDKVHCTEENKMEMFPENKNKNVIAKYKFKVISILNKKKQLKITKTKLTFPYFLWCVDCLGYLQLC